MIEAQWLGYQFEPDEMTLLLSLAGSQPVPGVRMEAELTEERAKEVCNNLLRKGFLWHVEDQSGMERTCELLFRELAAYTGCLHMSGLSGDMTLYQTPQMWLCVEQPTHRPCRLFPMETALEAYDMAVAYATQAGGHLSVRVWHGQERVETGRLKDPWRTDLDRYWARLVQH